MLSCCSTSHCPLFYWILNAFFASRYITVFYIINHDIICIHRNHQRRGVKSLLKRLNFKCISCLYAKRCILSSFFFKRFIILKITELTVDAIIELIAGNGGLLPPTKGSVYIKLG